MCATDRAWGLLLILLGLGTTGCLTQEPGLQPPTQALSFHNRNDIRYTLPRTARDPGGATTAPTGAERLALDYADDNSILFTRTPSFHKFGPTEAMAMPIATGLGGGVATSMTQTITRTMSPTEWATFFVQEHVQNKKGQDEAAALLVAFQLYMGGQPDAALERLNATVPTGDPFTHSLLKAMVLRKLGMPTEALSGLTREIKTLRQQNEIRIESLLLAKSVRSLGDYEKFPTYEFDRNEAVIVYFEPRNFTCEQKGNDQYQTALDITIAIYDRDNEERKTWTLAMDHKTKSYLFDLYVCTRDLVLPALEPGKYTMKISIKDRSVPDSTPAEEALAFRIKA